MFGILPLQNIIAQNVLGQAAAIVSTNRVQRMYFGAIKECDIANGIGVRISLFVSGCRHRCKGCFQPETWEFDYGEPFTAETEARLLALLAPSYISGLTVLGGEPFEPENQLGLIEFLRKVRTSYPEKTIWVYTGFTLEQLTNPDHKCRTPVTEEMLSYIDVLVDGPFIEKKKNLMLQFRGSENQRLLNLKETLRAGEPVIWINPVAR